MICPFSLINYDQPWEQQTNCLGVKCAWFDGEQCAVLSATQFLDAIVSNIKTIASNGIPDRTKK